MNFPYEGLCIRATPKKGCIRRHRTAVTKLEFEIIVNMNPVKNSDAWKSTLNAHRRKPNAG